MVNQGKSRELIAIISFIAFVVIIGLGMFTTNHIYNIPYTDSNMVKALIWFEIALVLLAAFVIQKFFSFKQIGFRKIKKSGLYWFLPILLIVLVSLFFTLKDLFILELTSTQLSLIATIFVTTLLVGISEELVFRGVVLHAFRQKRNIYVAVIISSITFSLIHSVNYFGGLTIDQIIGQLIATFVIGLYLSLIMVKLNNIIVLIVFHWFYDFILLTYNYLNTSAVLEVNNLTEISNPTIGTTLIVFVVSIIPLLFFIKNEGKTDL